MDASQPDCSHNPIGPGELFEAAIGSIGGCEGETHGAVSQGLYLAAYVCHSLLVSSFCGGKGYEIRFIQAIVPLLLTSRDGECEQAAFDFVEHYSEKHKECRQPLAKACVDLLQRSLGSSRHEGRPDDNDDESGGFCSPTVAARACASLVTACLRSSSKLAVMDQDILACLEQSKFALPPPAAWRACLPRIFTIVSLTNSCLPLSQSLQCA